MPGFVTAVAVALGVAGWRACGRYGERCSEAGQQFPHYGTETGRIDLVMHDLSGDGIVDTWVYQNDRGIEEIEIDRDEDGAIDQLFVTDQNGRLHLADPAAEP